ncbi:hypothetical protein ACFYE9_24995 [Rhizobium leguminosarum]|uniref:Uncharacterized protein n=2 Tax=Rhizobium leguminosarum TaxID=384 RepID=A0ACD5F068_RHILE|nr:hypothetical protein [Rhizobium leguminosarum]
MNINMTVRCDECSNHTNCRCGMSNRDHQPLKFTCRNCGSTIGITFDVQGADSLDTVALAAMLSSKNKRKPPKLNQGVRHRVTGATEVEGESPFKPGIDFVDLHLDFPVVFGEYEMGNTPYMQASMRSGAERAAFHRDRLGLVNAQYKKYPQVIKLIGMYNSGFHGPFAVLARKSFKVEVRSKRLEDINAALYTVVSHYVLPFTLPDTSQGASRKFTHTVLDLLQSKREATGAFLQKLYDTEYLVGLQRDCLKIYKPIFHAEMPLRPALFLDLDPSYVEGQVPMRVSTNDFEEYKEVYKDMAEIYSRQLVLVAGINNLIKRGDHDAFASGVWVTAKGKDQAPDGLEDYADVALGNKPRFLDDPWFTLDPVAQDNKLRNGIAHAKIDYNEVTQKITYYPKLEGMQRASKEEIFLLDYMRRMLALFREVHRLHHLIKCLNYAILLEPGASLIKKPPGV